MPNKALRILIADEQHFHRMKIERGLNPLGYYRIAPVSGLEELLSVVEYGCEPFDLVILNAALCQGTGLDPLAFCQDNPQIRHAMVYDAQQGGLSALFAVPPHKVTVCQARLPDHDALESLMGRIDPPGLYAEGERPGQITSMRA